MEIKQSEEEFRYWARFVKAAIMDLKGSCKHCGVKTNPAYTDIVSYLWKNNDNPILRKDHLTDEVIATLHRLEARGEIKGSGGYYKKGTHGGAGAKKWEIVPAEDCDLIANVLCAERM